MKTLRNTLCALAMAACCCLAILWASSCERPSYPAPSVNGLARSVTDTLLLPDIVKASVYEISDSTYAMHRVPGAWAFCTAVDGPPVVIVFSDDGSVLSSRPVSDWVYDCILWSQDQCKNTDQWEEYTQCFANSVNGCVVMGYGSATLQLPG